MDKKDVEQILIIVKSGQAEALNIKIYKDGTLCRFGCGGLPEIGISGMSFTGTPELFNSLMELVPQEFLDNPINYQDEKINTPLEYIAAFYGVSKNAGTGERAEWTKSTGIRILIDTSTTFRHPVLSFVDTFALDAAEQTNSWYFDVIINAVYNLKSTMLPVQTIIGIPKTDKEIQAEFENYVTEIRYSSRQWDLPSFAKNKVYLDNNNNEFRPDITQTGDIYHFNFVPVAVELVRAVNEHETQKKWWKFW